MCQKTDVIKAAFNSEGWVLFPHVIYTLSMVNPSMLESVVFKVEVGRTWTTLGLDGVSVSPLASNSMKLYTHHDD